MLQCDIVAIDAIRFSSMKDQFEEEWVLRFAKVRVKISFFQRELNKAYVGFSLNEKQKNNAVATGSMCFQCIECNK